MGKFGTFMGKAFAKTKGFVKDEMKKNKEQREKIEKMSDKELKRRAIKEGNPYEDAYLKRMKNVKRLNQKIKQI